MNFISNEFVLFVVVFFCIYYLASNSILQNIICLVGSYFFYAWWDWRFLLLITACILFSFAIGKAISKTRKKIFLYAGIAGNLLFLGYFKYANFFVSSLTDLLEYIGIRTNSYSLNIILPVGISFFIFQAISYIIDLYSNRLKKPYDLLTFASYVSLFPQLVAGPIVRAKVLMPQLEKRRTFSWPYLLLGIEAIIIGVTLKVVVADRLAPLADRIYADPELQNGLGLIIGTLFFAFQIYGDFAGYSLIAIGVAYTLHMKFHKNFNRPYCATSFSEFWERWHISLSSWLRDYLYIPLGGNRNGNLKTYRNLFVTMLLGGLWHGANLTFVFWGFLHGLYLTMQRIVDIRLYRGNYFNVLFSRAGVFLCVCVAWIFFRSDTVWDAFAYIAAIINSDNYSFALIRNKIETSIGLVIIFALLLIEILNEDTKWISRLRRSRIFRLLWAITLIFCILLLGRFSGNDFIYFQF